MSNTAKWIIGIIVALLVIAGIWSYSSKSVVPTGEKQTITIGASLPLTGNLAFLGESYKNSMLLAYADLQKSGQLKNNYKFVFEDDQFDAAKAATTANKLISIDKVDAIASAGSPAGNTISPIAEQNKIIHIGLASDPTMAKGDYNFDHWTPPYSEAKLLISEFQKRGIKNVVLFEQNQPGVLAFTNSLRSQLAGTGIKLIDEEKFNDGTRDFRTLITKAKSASVKADIYLLETTSPELEVLVKQLKEAGVKTPITCVESFGFSDNPSLFEGDWYIDAADQQAWYIAEYKQTYPGKAPKLGGGNGYDITKLLITSFENAGNSTDQATLIKSARDYLAGVKDFKGAMGDSLSVDPDGFILTNATVKMIKGGQVVPAQ